MIEIRTTGERLAILETQIDDLKGDMEEIKDKLDDLIALRNRGIGAFWLVSTLLGTSIFGMIMMVKGWLK